jgi:rRNA maturation RNase YbeY
MPTLNKKKAVRFFIPEIFRLENKSLKRLDYIFCSDEYLLEINKINLQHDYYTDIITFDCSKDEKIIGEIYISIDRVMENAAIFKTTFSKELHRVLFHGALHLCGYNDKTKKERALIRQKEDYYIGLLQGFQPK